MGRRLHTKKIPLILAFLTLFIGGTTEATSTGPYIVYTIELLDAGDAGMFEEVPGSLYLYPHVYKGDYKWNSPEAVLNGVLNILRSFKPKLYKGTHLMAPIPEDYEFKSVTVMTDVKTETTFKILMSEVVTTFNATAFLMKRDIPVRFHFKNPKLEKKFGGKVFRKKDIPFAIFLLTPPKNASTKDFDALADEIDLNTKVMSDIQK